LKPSTLLGAVPLGIDLLEGNKQPANYGTLEQQAGTLAAGGNQLQSYLQSGTLPPGLQTSLNSAATAAQAAIKSRYATTGMSGSSAESQDLQNVANQVSGQGAQIALQLSQQGLSETQLSDQLYAQLMQTSLSQDNALSSAVGNFAGALALGGARSPAAA
jgi:hypothetical protein